MRFFIKGWLVTVALSYAILSLTGCEVEQPAPTASQTRAQRQSREQEEYRAQQFKRQITDLLADKLTSTSKAIEERTAEYDALTSAITGLENKLSGIRAEQAKLKADVEGLVNVKARIETFARQPLPQDANSLRAARDEANKL